MIGIERKLKKNWRFGQLLLLVLITGASLRAQESTFYPHSLSVNPVKMVMGLVNVEHEFATNRQWAVKAFGEWLIGDDIWITNQSHPKFVMNAGLRYYWKKDEDQKQMKGAFSGLNIGKVYMLPENAGNSNTLGFETGYRFAFQQRWFVSPKLLLNYLTAHNYLLVGLEVQLGRVF